MFSFPDSYVITTMKDKNEKRRKKTCGIICTLINISERGKVRKNYTFANKYIEINITQIVKKKGEEKHIYI